LDAGLLFTLLVVTVFVQKPGFEEKAGLFLSGILPNDRAAPFARMGLEVSAGMKGPGMRIDLDVRRVWECPACGRRRRAEGSVTALKCVCQPDGVQMKLIEGRRTVRKFPFPAPEPPRLEETPPFGGGLDDPAPEKVVVPAADAATCVEPGVPDMSSLQTPPDQSTIG
jgi:hypothetical protein